MFNGIYSAATALDMFSRQQELISSNLAHLNTPGYRRELFRFQENSDVQNDQSESRPGASVDKAATDFSEGIKQTTGRQLDVAISGDAFFVYQGEQGELFSRNGALFRDPEGKLVNSDGLAILDDGSPIVIPPEVSDYDLSISSDGRLSANGTEFGQLSLVHIDNLQSLNSESQIYFTLGEATATPAEDSRVTQGTREISNAHPVTELISLIVGSRNFESAQRAIRTISDTVQENIRS